MPLYRIHQRLLLNASQGLCLQGGEGVVHSLSSVSADHITALLKTGAISLVQAPPLDTFTGWVGRARKLDSLGIDTIGFVTMKPRDIAYSIRASVDTGSEQEAFDQRVDQLALAVERWQREIKNYLGIGSAYIRR